MSLEQKHSRNQREQKYGPGGIQTLEFNTEKEKLIIIDSK